MHRWRRLLPCLAFLPLAVWAEEGQAPHWGYGEADGPARWSTLDADWTICAEGTQQSPIDLGAAESAAAAAPERRYGPTSLRIAHQEHIVDVVDNGHTIQVQIDGDNALVEGGTRYELQQLHFHAPSEHEVGGRAFPMEMHLVHRAADGALAVVGVFIEEGAHNPAFEPIFSDLPTKPGGTRHLEHVEVDVDDLLPPSGAHYRYAGSLTTPPCSEGVTWLVLEEPVALSTAQIAAFTSIFPNNRRPVQPRGARAIGRVVLEQVDAEAP